MMKKLNELSIAAYMHGTAFVQNLKRDERGLSGVVVAVLLILVAVLAVVLIWNFLGEWIGNMWTRITGLADGIS